MRSVLLLLVVALAACDTSRDQPDCPSPFDVDLAVGEAALVRASSFDIDFDCQPVVQGMATWRADAVVIETELDTLRLSFGPDGSLHGVEYGRGRPSWSTSGPHSGSLDSDDGRGRFEVVVNNGSLFPVRDTLRGQFHALMLGGA